MKWALILAGLGAMAAGAPAAAQAVSHSPIEAAPRESEQLKPGQQRVKVRCRAEVSTGTRFSQRRCRRLDDLARAEADAKEVLENVSRQALDRDPRRSN